MAGRNRAGDSPQARGRELARLGTQLWKEAGSVKRAAVELMDQHPDICSLQAHRYVCGLSQDQAALRYNEVTDHQTSLGGTSINAWESWARRSGAGSPPAFSSLLILATAYSGGPLGIAGEHLSPSDLIAESYERLAPEDQLSLKRFTAAASPSFGRTGSSTDQTMFHPQAGSTEGAVIGRDFNLAAPTVEHGNPEICAYTLPNPKPGQLLNLPWSSFGFGLERLIQQIKNVGRRLDVDACFGINEAGLVCEGKLGIALEGLQSQ